ncbi:MAG: HAD domain-containing protein [Succinivibrionaceae bacterium]
MYNDRIIFLDIDGVLNRDDHHYDEKRHEFYNENMVKELSYIIKKTGVKIILPSSWRGAISNYINGKKAVMTTY